MTSRAARFAIRFALVAVLVAACGTLYWKLAIPTHRFAGRSELVMLGDLDGDRRWGAGDLERLEAFLRAPFQAPVQTARLVDLNQNGLLDGEDIAILRALVAANGDPYAAEEQARARGRAFPMPRELYRYVSLDEYATRPLWALPHDFTGDPLTAWLAALPRPDGRLGYSDALNADIHAEAVRFDLAWRQRRPGLQPREREYAERKLTQARALLAAGDRYGLLLALMDLVEDAETLTTRDQPEFPLRLLAFRDHLRDALASPQFAAFRAGQTDQGPVLALIEQHLRADLGLDYDLKTLGKPRNLLAIENYAQRAEWQYYKSFTGEAEIRALVLYAQHDPRYLRAVSRTSRKFQDPNVANHNLPMVLLFREALRIRGGDKKKAVALLDESIRIPFGWVKSIPRETLPGSVALENFLLPGNKEDGADKSRHWNVFGGICLYKSPQEALDLALRREAQDLREEGGSPEAMTEFIRDMVANLNGMYHVLTVNPSGFAAGFAGS